MFRLGSSLDWEQRGWYRGFSELPLASLGGLAGLRKDQEPGNG